MKLLIATPLYPPEAGGPATYSKLLEDGLPPLGLEVALVKFGDVRHLPKLLRHAAYFFRVLKGAGSADVVYALDAVSVGFPAMLAAKLARKPFVVKIVGDYAWEQGRQRFGITRTLDEFVKEKYLPLRLAMFRWIQVRVAKSAKIIVVPSEYLKDIVTKGWRIRGEKVTVIHNAIRAHSAGAVPKAVAALPRPLIVSIGRLVPWKGFVELIEAVAMLRKKKIPASLAIVGDGPDKELLDAKAKESLEKDFVLTGALPHAQAYDVMLAADVFVLDSLYEGLSHTLVEAFAAGVPVVVSDIPGNTEIVHNEGNGLVVAPGDSRALERALERVLTDENLRTRLASASKASGADFSVDAMLQKTAIQLRAISAQ